MWVSEKCTLGDGGEAGWTAGAAVCSMFLERMGMGSLTTAVVDGVRLVMRILGVGMIELC